MKDFVIMTDSGCDLSKDLVNELNIEVVPMRLFIDNKEYKHYPDCRELSMDAFYSKIENGHIGKTSCVNIVDISNVMRKYAQQGMDILYLSFSAGMSSSWQFSVLASHDVMQDYPNCNIKVINTCAGSSGLGLLTYLAAKEKEKGKNFEEVVEFVANNKLNISHYFVVDDLMYIQKAGRLSSASAIFGTAMGIKPIFKLSDEGKVVIETKMRGKKNAIKYLIKKTEQSKYKDLFFICHAKAEDVACQLKNKIQELYPETIIKINEIGPVVGNNTGPGTIGIMFLEER
jgi:DegV family protein with EDD domain